MNYTKVFIVAIMTLIVSTYFLYRHFSQSEIEDYKENIKRTTELIQNGIKTNITYDDEITVLSRKHTKTYTLNFTYHVNGKSYEKSISAASEDVLLNDLQNDTIIYDPNNPGIYSFNPEKDLEYNEGLLNNPSLYEFPWLLLAVFISSIGVIIYSFFQIKSES